MSRRGRPPKPTELKRMQGNPGRRPLNGTEPQPEISKQVPDAPSWLGEEARRIWEEHAPALHKMRMLTDVDVMAFGAFCQWFALYLHCMRQINDDPGLMVQESQSGYRQQDPVLSIASNAWAHAQKLLGHFGLTPAERSRMRIEQVEKELSLAEELFALTQQLGGQDDD